MFLSKTFAMSAALLLYQYKYGIEDAVSSLVVRSGRKCCLVSLKLRHCYTFSRRISTVLVPLKIRHYHVADTAF